MNHNIQSPRPFILSAPSGAGKTTVARHLIEGSPEIKQVITATTRPPRYDGEKDYIFLSEKEFHDLNQKKGLIEATQIFGHWYGTPYSQLTHILEKGCHALLIIDVQGALEIKKKINAVTIFLSPPSLGELERRMSKRGSETKEVQAMRLARAKQELAMISHYDYNVVNRSATDAAQEVRSIIFSHG